MSKKFLLSAIFAAGAVGAPAVAGDMQVLNEEELEEVSAQGFQTVTTEKGSVMSGPQNNNLDSVQLNDSSQQDATLALIINTAKSALNTGVNLLYDSTTPGGGSSDKTLDPDVQYIVDKMKEHIIDPTSGTFDNSFTQENDLYAYNHQNVSTAWVGDAEASNINKQTQTVDNRSPITDQDNNNASVQLNVNAQMNASGLLVENSASSANNFGLNVLAAGALQETTGYQKNFTDAQNMTNSATTYGDSATALAQNAEDGKTQKVDNWENIEDQDNNNNSVQLNDSAQQNMNAIAAVNIAQSAANLAANLIAVTGIENSTLEQDNFQWASNHVNDAYAESGTAKAMNVNKQSQEIGNNADPDADTFIYVTKQNNNNNSVQLNDSAQQDATAFYLANAASSALNASVNILAVYGSDTPDVNGSILLQHNDNVADNFSNYANGASEAIASNRETLENPGQFINNIHAQVDDQDNNNNSVQLNDSAQQNAQAFVMLNSAMSAVNLGVNLLYIEGNTTGTSIDQWNDQSAYSHYNDAYSSGGYAEASNINKQTQEIRNCNCSVINGQNNNMNSVQLNDSAQQSATALLIVNSADSAVNLGANLAITAGTVTGSVVTQYNYSEAYNFSNYAEGASATATNAEGFSF